jgi:DNA gyrase subunit A
MLTRGGYIKKTALSAFSNIRANGLIAISLEEGDQLRWVRLARTEDSVLIGSRHGMTIHFKTSNEQLRPLGRPTKGVRAMSLRNSDTIIGMDILPAQITAAVAASSGDDSEELDVSAADCALGPWVLAITAAGLGKRVPVNNFRLQNRAGMGLVGMKFRKDNDELVALRVVGPQDELMLVTNRGIIIRQSICAISVQSRMATGVQLQRLDEDDAIAAVAIIPQTDEPPADSADTETADPGDAAVAATEPEVTQSEATEPAAD